MANENGITNIHSLPNELLLATFGYLVPDPVSTDFNGSLDEEYVQRRETLRNLCLASKRLNIAAQKDLYRNVAITDGTQLFPLFRNLWNNSNLRGNTRFFACLVKMGFPDVTAPVLEAWNEGFKSLSADVSHPLVQYFLDTGFIKLERVEEAGPVTEEFPSARDFPALYVPQILLAGIFAMQNGVQGLLLMSHPGQWPSFRFIDNHDGALVPGVAGYHLKDVIFSGPLVYGGFIPPSLTDGPGSSTLSLPKVPMSTVKSLRMIPGASPEKPDETMGRIEPTSVHFWHLENVTKIEIKGDNGGWFSLLSYLGKYVPHPMLEEPKGPVPDAIRNDMVNVMKRITDLRLTSSGTSLPKMGALLSLLTNLKTLHWSFRARDFDVPDMPHEMIVEDDSVSGDGDDDGSESDGSDSSSGSDTAPAFTISRTLKKASKELESLHIETVPEATNGISSSVSFPERLRGLARFEKLKYLTLDMPMIMSPADFNQGRYVAEGRLPSSLVRLNLIQRWTDDTIRNRVKYEFPRISCHARALQDLAHCCTNTHPNLRSISIKSFHPVRDARNLSARYTEEQFKKLRDCLEPETRELVSLFEEVGVTFELHFVPFPTTLRDLDRFAPLDVDY